MSLLGFWAIGSIFFMLLGFEVQYIAVWYLTGLAGYVIIGLIKRDPHKIGFCLSDNCNSCKKGKSINFKDTCSV